MHISEWKKGWHLWDLIDHIRAVGALGSGYIYRGQANAAWGLVPGLYRRGVHIFSETLSSSELYRVAEKKMVTAFFNRAVLLLPFRERGPLMDLFIAQHYGVPTQLLDWTLDPFIALYFAMTGGDPSDDRALFYVHPKHRVTPHKLIDFPWNGPITNVTPPIIDERIRAQKSTFTIQSFGKGDRFEALDKRELSISEPSMGTQAGDQLLGFGKIIIPAKHRSDVLHHLLHYGVDSSMIYPGLQGIGQRISEVADLGNYGGSLDF